MIAAQILPHIGVMIGNDELTTAVTTIISVVSAPWIMVRRYKMGGKGVLGGRR